MNLSSGWNHRWHATRLIHQRDMWSMIFGPGIYIVLALSLLISMLLLSNNLNFINENGLLVVSGAFNVPVTAVIFITSIFLALSSVTTIAREREHGTMEALFYGPVDSVSYVMGKYLAQISTYLVMVLIYVVCFTIYARLTNLSFPVSMGWIVLLSVLISSNFIAIGIFLSTIGRRVRTAILLFLTVAVLFLIIEMGQQFLLAIPVDGSYYNPLLFLQDVFTFLNQLTDWVSPFSYLTRGVEAIRRSSTLAYLLIFLISAVYTLVFLGFSVATLERKGVRK